MKDYLRDYLAGRRGEEFPANSKGEEVPKVPEGALIATKETFGTSGTYQGVEYPENLEAEPTADPDIDWRIRAMLPQIPAVGPLPFLTAREAAEARDGCCLSCGDLLDQADAYRCGPCSRAAYLAIEISMSPGKTDVQQGERID